MHNSTDESQKHFIEQKPHRHKYEMYDSIYLKHKFRQNYDDRSNCFVE